MDQNDISQFWLRNGVVKKVEALSLFPMHGFPVEGGFDFYDGQNRKVAKLILPITFPHTQEQSFKDYVNSGLEELAQDVIIVLMQAGDACLGRVSEGELISHKLIRKYMVRKSQGKSQIKHLNSKGKSKAGSRIRLAQTVKFFEEINEQLILWFEEGKPQRIAYHVPVNMKSLWYESKVATPFEKDDLILRKTYWDVQKPRREEIIRSMRLMNCARMTIFDPDLKDEIIPILEKDD